MCMWKYKYMQIYEYDYKHIILYSLLPCLLASFLPSLPSVLPSFVRSFFLFSFFLSIFFSFFFSFFSFFLAFFLSLFLSFPFFPIQTYNIYFFWSGLFFMIQHIFLIQKNKLTPISALTQPKVESMSATTLCPCRTFLFPQIFPKTWCCWVENAKSPLLPWRPRGNAAELQGPGLISVARGRKGLHRAA